MQVEPQLCRITTGGLFYQKAKQLISSKKAKILGVTAALFSTLALLYFSKNRYPHADEQCVKQLEQEFDQKPADYGGKKITDIFGGVHGFCSLPKLVKPDDRVFIDPNKMKHPLMRGTTRDGIHYLSIKTEVICSDADLPAKIKGLKGLPVQHCPNRMVGVEHLTWNLYNRTMSIADPNFFFKHLDYLPKKRLDTLKALVTTGSAKIDLKNSYLLPRVPLRPFGDDGFINATLVLPIKYTINLKY